MDIRTQLSPGLYIHIPFCIRKCGYCGFYSVTDRTLIPDFLMALRREMALLPGAGRTIRYALYRRRNPLRSPPGRSRRADRQPSRGLHDRPRCGDHRRSQPGRHRSGLPAGDAGSRGEPSHHRLPVLRRYGRSPSWAAATRPGRRARPSRRPARPVSTTSASISSTASPASPLPAGRRPSRRPSPCARPPLLLPAHPRGGHALRRAVPQRGDHPSRRRDPGRSLLRDLPDPRRKRLYSLRGLQLRPPLRGRIAAQQEILGPYPLSRPRPGGPLLRRPEALLERPLRRCLRQRACRGTPARCGVGAAHPGPVTDGGPVPRFSDQTGGEPGGFPAAVRPGSPREKAEDPEDGSGRRVWWRSGTDFSGRRARGWPSPTAWP